MSLPTVAPAYSTSTGVSIFSVNFWKDPRIIKLSLLGSGMVIFFLIYGLLQERIMSFPYGDDKEMFKSSTYLVLNNRVVAILIAASIMYYRAENMKNSAPLYNYAGVSFSNFLSTWCQYEALKFVNFPTQTLGKCGKMIPVMVIGTFISGKKYGLDDYLAAASISVGCMVFLLTGKFSQSDDSDTQSSMLGLVLVLGYLFCDGFTSTLQEKMFKGYTMSTYQQMFYTNLISVGFSLVALNASLVDCIYFSIRHPDFFVHSLGLSVCAALGQVLIYTTIKDFGALIFAAIMTTRQLLNILLSCIIYVHPLTLGQWFGVAMVFGTAYYKADSKGGRGAPSSLSSAAGASSPSSNSKVGSESAAVNSSMIEPIEIKVQK